MREPCKATAPPAPKRKIGTIWRPPRGSWVRIDLRNEHARAACRETIGRDLGRDGIVEGRYVGPDRVGLAEVELPVGGRCPVPFAALSRIPDPRKAA